MVESVQCPVCTLYLHAGMNLSDHLDTHPKEQVIKALVQMTIVGSGPGTSTANALAAAVLAGNNDDKATSSIQAAVAEVKPIVVVTTPPATSPKASTSADADMAAGKHHSNNNSSSSNSNNCNKLNNPPIKQKYEGLKTTTQPQQNHPRPPTTAAGQEQASSASTTPTHSQVHAQSSYQQQQPPQLQQPHQMTGDFRYEQQQSLQFQHTTRGGGVTATTTLAYSAGSLLQPQQHPQQQQHQQQPQQHQQQQHHYLNQQARLGPQQHHHNLHHQQQSQTTHFPPHQQGLKYALPPPPPLQLFGQLPSTSQSAQHQKPPPAYGAAISQIRSQHNQNKQQQHQHHLQQQQQHQQQQSLQQQQQLFSSITIHQIPTAPPATPTPTLTGKHHKNPHTEIFLNPPPPPPPQSSSTATTAAVPVKYEQPSTSSSSSRMPQQTQPPSAHMGGAHMSSIQAIGQQNHIRPSTSSQMSPARACVSGSRQTNSPFGALLTAAAAVCASPSSVLRYAESPVAHYLERENGDFIVQETPKHIVECVEKEDGEFSVIERIYQSPPSVLRIHDDDEDDEDEVDGSLKREESEELHVADGDDEREDSHSRASIATTTTTTTKKQRASKVTKTKAATKAAGKATTSKRQSHKKRQQNGATELSADQEETEFMSLSSGSESDEPVKQANQSQSAAPSTSSSSASAHTTTGDATSSNSCLSGASSSTKSKKNRITVLSDVPLNMNEYLDLVGNIVASSRVGASRAFAAVAPLPMVKVEKEEPLDDYDEVTSFSTAPPPHLDAEDEEEKPSLGDQLQATSGSGSGGHAPTSVIRMASTNAAQSAAQQQQQENLPEDLTQPPTMKIEVEPTALLPQRFAAPATSNIIGIQQRGPKKLVIKPKSTTTTTAKTKKTDNATATTTSTITNSSTSSSNSSLEPKASTSAAALSISKNLPETVQIKSEITESPTSILEKHLTTTSGGSASGSSYHQRRKVSGVNDDDARVLLEFANSKQPPTDGMASTTFVVNAATFPSANSVFASGSGNPQKSGSDEYILPDNNVDVDEIVISSSSSYASQQQPPLGAPDTSAAQQQHSNHHQQQNQAGSSFNDFNFNLYHHQANSSAGYEHGHAKAHGSAGKFSPFNFQQQPLPHSGASEATNAATVASSSSSSSASSSAGSVILDHDSMNATFPVAKPGQPDMLGAHGGAGNSSWYHQQHNHEAPQPTNFNAALAAVDCCNAVAVDGEVSGAKYLDLDACKQERQSGSSISSVSIANAANLLSGSVSASTTSSSFAAAATESSLVGGLNIRTDEKMPAKGEISEQESNCDIENSWSQSMYGGDMSPRYFRNQFSAGAYTQLPDWRESYYPAEDLSPEQRENKHFDFRLPVDVANNSVADYMFPNNNDLDSSSEPGMSNQAAAKKGKRRGPGEQNYLLDAQPTTSSSALLAGPPIASTSRAAAAAAAATASGSSAPALETSLVAMGQRKPPRRKIYKCPHCEAIFEKLKERNAHMINLHNYVRQNRRLICTQAAVGLVPATAVTSTITHAGEASSSDQMLFTQPTGSSSTIIEDSKDGIIKIKQENCQEKAPAERRTTLDQMDPQSELPDVKDAGLLAEPSTADIKPHQSLLNEVDEKPQIQPLAMTTPAAKLATLYRMLISYNESKLGQDRPLNELEQKAMEKSIFLCYVCRTDFPSVKLYDAHLTEHPAECFTCGKKFYRWKNFSLHLKRHLGWKEFGCYVCNKKFVVRSALVEHMRMHTGVSPLKCKICGKRFKRYSNLTQHRKRHTKMMVRKKEYVCYCGEVLPSKARFLWHKETHDLKPKCCPYCCDRFVHANSLRRHIRLAHSDKFDYAEPMECPMCKQIFAKTSIKAHMATHSTDPQYDCAICNKSFSTKWNLKIHSWVHANRTAKPFKCEYCPKAFVRELDFKNHLNAHKQIKPYTCEYCGCKFIRKYNYMRHRREHHGNKKFTCDQCDKSFHRHYYLIEHRRIHTGERPFQCTICGKSSTTKTNHNKHLKIHHSRDPFTVEV